MERPLTKYEQSVIREQEENIQYHEMMKRSHDEAIEKARKRIAAINEGRMIESYATV